ncbi:MAG: DUF504 domain-containing protein [Betaproteobacteria bacterium]|nr:MAG: DUF504 domain-containing protein [Betaproteobacteria bacterium]
MIPIHELLARIRWDPGFGRARFEIAYLDRKRKALVRLPLERTRMSAEERFAFEALEEDGSVHSVPYHRVRAVWRDGELVWSRKAGRGSAV